MRLPTALPACGSAALSAPFILSVSNSWRAVWNAPLEDLLSCLPVQLFIVCNSVCCE